MDFKDILLISDYDNTMTGERHLVPEENLRAIREFTAEGGAFTIASGRGMREWYESFCEVPFNAPLVLSNGAVIYDTIENKILYEAVLSEEQKRLTRELFRTIPEGCGGLIEVGAKSYIPAEIYEKSLFKGFPGQEILTPPMAEIPDGWSKVCFIQLPTQFNLQDRETFEMSRFAADLVDEAERQAEEIGLKGIRSLPFVYEISPEGVDKGTSARRLLEILGKKVLAVVGDAPNDLAMLQAADLAFVPRESILTETDTVPEGAILTVRCEEAALADVIRLLREMKDM